MCACACSVCVYVRAYHIGHTGRSAARARISAAQRCSVLCVACASIHAHLCACLRSVLRCACVVRIPYTGVRIPRLRCRNVIRMCDTLCAWCASTCSTYTGVCVRTAHTAQACVCPIYTGVCVCGVLCYVEQAHIESLYSAVLRGTV